MFTFMTAYLIVWFAVLAYMVRLGREQRRLRRTAEALQTQFEKQDAVATKGRVITPVEGRTMKISILLLCAALAAAPAAGGTIQGTVVNTSSGAPVPCQVTVDLQVQVRDQLVPFREVVSDKQGQYRFERLPAGDGVVYQAGATRHGIFYPGPRIRLTDLQPIARSDLSVCDAVTSPDPLVLKKMDVVIRPETGLLKVTESLLLENPTHTCYVGEAAHDGADPVTLELSIPPEFERTTFDQEFFGRRFHGGQQQGRHERALAARRAGTAIHLRAPQYPGGFAVEAALGPALHERHGPRRGQVAG